MKNAARIWMFCGCAYLLGVLLSRDLLLAQSPRDVWTQRYDNARTGTYAGEHLLNPSNVAGGTFRELYHREVDGPIAAQPLYVTDVLVSGRRRNVLFIATRTNHVYAFDADSTDRGPRGGIIWHVAPGMNEMQNPDTEVQNSCSVILGPVGISSTPVIDVPNRTIFLVSRGVDKTYRLHALDIATGLPRHVAKVIQPEMGFSGVPTPDTSGVRTPDTFHPESLSNKPGLLLLNGHIYVAFANLTCDGGNSRGWIFSFDAGTLKLDGEFATSTGSDFGAVFGGIWQSGHGLAADSRGNIYCLTGNADNRHTSADTLENSVLKIKTGGSPNDRNDLQLVGKFKPNNYDCLNGFPGFFGDVDLGSGGPTLLPDGHLVAGGKQGRLYLLDRDRMTVDGRRRDALVFRRGADTLTTRCDSARRLDPDQQDHDIDGLQAATNTWHADKTYAGGVLFVCPQVTPNPCDANPGDAVVMDGRGVTTFRTIPADPYRFHHDGNTIIGSRCYIDPGEYERDEFKAPNLHGGPVFWQSQPGGPALLFIMAEKDYLRSYRVKMSDISLYRQSTLRAPDGMPGGALSISTDNGLHGIVWASFPEGDSTCLLQPGTLVALDALTLKELWRSHSSYTFAKFVPPTIADGKVYVATSDSPGKVIVYGLMSNVPPIPEGLFRPLEELTSSQWIRDRISGDLVTLEQLRNPDWCPICLVASVSQGALIAFRLDQSGAVTAVNYTGTLNYWNTKDPSTGAPTLKVSKDIKGFEGCPACEQIVTKGGTIRGFILSDGHLRAIIAGFGKPPQVLQ